ncbi:MAG: Ig-like domain-containing protein, partial [Gemmatimonadaceae bacterium]
MFRLTRIFMVACAVALAACSDSESTGPVTNEPVAVSSVLMTPVTASVIAGNTTQLNAVARDANNNTLANRAITWASSATNIATVNTQGLVAAVTPGSATITATSEGKTAQSAITVTAGAPAAVNSITLVTPVNAIIVGASILLTATTRDANNNVLAGRTITYTSSATTVATVNFEGQVTGIGAGNVTITATSEGKSAQVNIAVAALPVVAPVASIAITATPDTIEAWDVVNMQATLRDSINQVLTGRNVKWLSSNLTVASIDSVTGVMTGLDRGVTTIRAISEGKSAIVTHVVVIRYRSLTTATEHACNIASGGIVWCWGVNGTDARIGQSQTGDRVNSNVPVQLQTNFRFVQISSYGRFTCGIRTDSKAMCWGNNNWGALGVPTLAFSAAPVEVTGNISFRSLSAGADQMCGVATDSRAYCWGNNQWGQFGNGNSASNHIPQAVGGGITLNSITAGSSFGCGVTIGFAGFCWGADGDGQQGNGLPISNGNTLSMTPRPMIGPAFTSLYASASLSCGLTAAGSAYCWGSSTGGRLGSQGNATSTPREVAGGFSFRNLSVGAVHSCGVTQTFEVYCWGMNGNGQLGQTLTNGSVTPIRAGGSLLASEVSAANIATGSAA